MVGQDILRIMVLNKKGEFIKNLPEIMLLNNEENFDLLKHYADTLNYNNSQKKIPADKYYVVVNQHDDGVISRILAQLDTSTWIMRQYISERLNRLRLEKPEKEEEVVTV